MQHQNSRQLVLLNHPRCVKGSMMNSEHHHPHLIEP